MAILLGDVKLAFNKSFYIFISNFRGLVAGLSFCLYLQNA